MAELYRNDCVEWWKSQIGYVSGKSKSSKYSKMLDDLSWYNYKKNGYSDWCTIFYDAAVASCMTELNVNQGRAFVYEPNNDNCGAGCKQKVDYYKAHGAWYPHKAKGCPAQIGDQIFFYSDEYKKKENPLGVYHTGAVIDWDNKGLYTAEGNTNGCGEVSKRFYSYGDGRILGFGRPNWTANEAPSDDDDQKPEPTPEPIPEPIPTPEPKPVSTKSGMVKVNTVLNVRSGAGTSYPVVKQLSNQTTVTIYETKNGWYRIGDNQWVCADYVLIGKSYTVSVNSYLNVRSGPSTMSPAVGKKYNGNKVIVYEVKNNFGHIEKEQWCSMTYLK